MSSSTASFNCYDDKNNNIPSNILNDKDINKFSEIKITKEFDKTSHQLDEQNNKKKSKVTKKNMDEILQMSTKDFLEWHFNEIVEILDIIQKYKNSIYIYEIPKPPYKNSEKYIINDKLTNEELEKALQDVFTRSIIFFSYQFSSKIADPLLRTSMFLFFSAKKKYLSEITNEMDRRELRMIYGESKECLRDFLNYPRLCYENILRYGIFKQIGGIPNVL
uniref:NR LBD domain-containing protein n=1 Tax=Strongyloides stercoralis TaxID=6248 RepID=A0A0K0E604_STRER